MEWLSKIVAGIYSYRNHGFMSKLGYISKILGNGILEIGDFSIYSQIVLPLPHKKRKDMAAILPHQPLNSAQLFVLNTFATAKSEQEREELTSLYLDYIQRKMDIETNKWWEENEMTQEKFKEMFYHLHQRTPYQP
jgi:hypothetical protein